MTDRLTTKRAVLVLLLVTAAAVLVSGSREWLSGSVDDAGLGANALSGTGSEVAPGAMAAALVGLASAVAVATSGRLVRVIAAGAALLGAVLGVSLVLGVVADPAGALGTLAAAGTGRTGAVVTRARAGSWAWVALAATGLMGVGALGALVGGPRWRGLSSVYDAPAGSAPSHDSAWDQLSRGEDPTIEQ